MEGSIKPVAFVSGSSSPRGIGKACAKALALAGFNIVIHDLESKNNADNLFFIKKELEELGAEVFIVQGSVTQKLFRDTLFKKIISKFGRIDCVVNNAGTASLRRGDLLDVLEDSFDHCLDINTKALFFMCQNAAKELLKQKPLENYPLCIINITSCSASILSPSRGDYCVSKAAASMVSQLFALRLANTNIKVFEIRPGIIQTDMTLPVKDKYDNLIENGLVPENRWGIPNDVAKAVRAMATGQIPYTVGQIFHIDGGLNIRSF